MESQSKDCFGKCKLILITKKKELMLLFSFHKIWDSEIAPVMLRKQNGFKKINKFKTEQHEQGPRKTDNIPAGYNHRLWFLRPDFSIQRSRDGIFIMGMAIRSRGNKGTKSESGTKLVTAYNFLWYYKFSAHRFALCCLLWGFDHQGEGKFSVLLLY